MRIKCLEIQNFRKLAAVRIDLAEQSTVFVGANNSGKTSALLALRAFLLDGAKAFRMNDIHVARWAEINAIGESWLASDEVDLTDSTAWRPILPALDLWFEVATTELHRVSALLPNLDWSGELVGVRVAFELKSQPDLYRDFRDAWQSSQQLRDSINEGEPGSGATTQQDSLRLWPENLADYLTRRMVKTFDLNHYVLDPSLLVPIEDNAARPQALRTGIAPLESDPLQHLIRIDEINAQRGFSDSNSSAVDAFMPAAEGTRLSKQLGAYYAKHLNPAESPGVEDLKALRTIGVAQSEFDERLGESFADALAEMQSLGYPGVTDPQIRISSKLSAVDSLDHESAVSFVVDVASGDGVAVAKYHLPEAQNGLGYQNLISMVFRLMSFRDAWMRVGKARATAAAIEPIHLVLVEEPEAHLHVQVQQVFARRAHEILRRHPDLQGKTDLVTQLVISTHSSHVAHELPFASLRYFRRLPAGSQTAVPSSSVVSLNTVFGDEDETEKFVVRYLRAQHADLFFADGVVLVEGPAEKILVPTFVASAYEFLNSSYISILEIGGSHAHRLRPLIEALQLTTLVITDLDATDGTGAVPVLRGASQKTGNPTLKDWSPLSNDVDALLDATEESKVVVADKLFAVRFAFQVPVTVSIGEKAGEALPSTFEDALVFENSPFFASLEGHGLTRKVREILAVGTEASAVGQELFDALKSGKKAEFALDILASEAFDSLAIPQYIANGLAWLESRLKKQVASEGDAVLAAAKNDD